MSAADWEEVKRLAADFQKAQLSYTFQKLSERNCVEIIMKLTENKLLDVIFTNDGKEYVTPQHLGKEIKDELYIHGGCISLVDVAKSLNVDISQINKTAADIEKHEKGIKIILGKLIDRNYINKVSEEINDKLNENGYINVAELTLHYDLPADFLQSVVEKELGKKIFGKQDTQDPKIFYNQRYIARNEAKIKGALAAFTKPTPLSVILNQCCVPERIFFSIIENLQDIPGVISGKQISSGIYVPCIYSKTQSEWVDNFYRQNGYLEYDALTRLGISDPKSFVRRHFSCERLMILDTVAVGQVIIDQVDANIEEVFATGSYTDIYPLLPSVFSEEDVEALIKETLTKMNCMVHIFAKTVVVSDTFLHKVCKQLEVFAESKAKDAVESGKWLEVAVQNKIRGKSIDVIDTKQDKKAERRKKATSGKAGGGNQGRETKTKSTKKKYLQGKNHENDSDDEHFSTKLNANLDFDFISTLDIKEELKKDEILAEMEELIEDLSSHYHDYLNKHVSTVAEKLLQTGKRINFNELEDKINVLVTNIRIFDKGVKYFDKNIQGQLVKYLLKSLGVDLVNEIFKLAAQQNVVQCVNNLTTEIRQKMILEFPDDVKKALSELHKAVSGNSVEDFLNAVDPSMAVCCIVLKKFDKKKERPVILGHREALLEQLNSTQDPALVLHLTCAILFIAATQNMLHFSGRYVSHVLSFLQPYIKESVIEILSKYHDMVLKFLSCSDESAKADFCLKLQDELHAIKAIANDYKKQLKSDTSDS